MIALKPLAKAGGDASCQQIAYRNAHNKDVNYVVAESTGEPRSRVLRKR